MAKEAYVEIASPHSMDELISRLQRITASKAPFPMDPGVRYVGEFKPGSAKVRDAYASPKSSSPTYFLNFSQREDQGIVAVSNNQYEMSSMIEGFFKGICIPFGMLFLILGIVKYRDPVSLIMGAVIGTLFISVSLLINAKKPTHKELSEDTEIKWLAKFFNGRIVIPTASVNERP